MVPKRVGLTVALVALVALSGCLSTGVLDDQKEEQVVEEFTDRVDEIDAYHATMIATTTIDGESEEIRTEVWARLKTGETRRKILAPEDRAGDLTVSNGSVMWTYDESDGTATRMDIGDVETDVTLGSYLDELTERYDVAYNGTATVDGEETYKVTLLPNASVESPIESTMTLWLDTDRMFPLKVHTDVGDNISTTVRYTDLEVNPDIPDERFQFDPPDGVEIEESGMPDFEQYDTRAALDDATERDVPDPDLPEGFAFESGTVSQQNDSQRLSLAYSNGTDRVSIGVIDGREFQAEGESVDLGEHTGTYDSAGDVGMVVWTCNGTQYSVTGTLDRSALVNVAASVDC